MVWSNSYCTHLCYNKSYNIKSKYFWCMFWNILFCMCALYSVVGITEERNATYDGLVVAAISGYQLLIPEIFSPMNLTLNPFWFIAIYLVLLNLFFEHKIDNKANWSRKKKNFSSLGETVWIKNNSMLGNASSQQRRIWNAKGWKLK